MSKKLNTSLNTSGTNSTPKNTLFNYFTKSPAVDKKKIPASPAAAVVKEEKENIRSSSKEEATKPNAKRKLNEKLTPAKKEKKQEKKVEKEKQNDDNNEMQGKRKRKVFQLQDSEDEAEEEDDDDYEYESKSEEDFSDDGSEYNPDGKESDAHSDDNEDDDDDDDDDDDASGDDDVDESMSSMEPTPKKSRKKINNNNNEPATKKLKLEVKETEILTSGTFMEKLEKLQSNAKSNANYDEMETGKTSTLDEPTIWPHHKLEFLQPDKIKDKSGRRPDHPDYDKSTLHVPEKFLNSLSPGVRQWWVLKSDSYDCVLFFKVGKFYELYHMDADVGVNELGFTYMRGEFAHSGFPEISFDKMSTLLVERGYKVARVEQTETPDMMTERCKRIKPTKFDKVVAREICQITDRGTQVFGSQCAIGPNHQLNYMLALVERDDGPTSRYGVCFIDTSIGDFHMGEFDDDKSCSRLLTLLAHEMPVLLLSERGSLSSRTLQILRTVLGGILKEQLPSNGNNLCTAEKTLKLLAERHYRKDGNSDNDNDDNWPSVLRLMQDDCDHLGLTPRAEYKMTLKALGQCVYYLGKCKLEEKVLPMAHYEIYNPPDVQEIPKVAKEKTNSRRYHMVLDASTLSNLRITGEEHSLQATLDYCCTKFGKRLLHHWLCAPSCSVEVIRERQEAISELISMGSDGVLQELRALLAPLPDFDRHLAQIHQFGSRRIAQDNHPDSRAILFEEKLYNKQKLINFIAILKGFESLALQLPTMFTNAKSKLLKLFTQSSDGNFPDLRPQLEFFANAFDHKEAAKTGVIAPQSGVDSDYDEVQRNIADIQRELQEYLVTQERHFGCRLSYFGSDKKRFQLDVPETHAHKANNSYSLEGQVRGKKPARRYSTAETRAFLKQMQQAEEARNVVLKDLARRIFEKFSNHYDLWKRCVDCVAHIDVLASLAEYANQQQVICIPQLVDDDADAEPFIELDEGYHPCVSAATYIPNGIQLGASDEAPLSLLTGPNMGGKSTLMRQMGLLVVMAQIGAHIPAASCRLTVVDRIFTRLGAQDDILSGHSTFLVELNETSLILKHATKHSLVLLDELGRGTATYDGTAIAASVVNFLADVKCRTLFSTHYHNLIDFFHNDKRITLGHMACMVEQESTEDPTEETVTFLYKYTAGACPKSYGFNAAKLAGMPKSIIQRAYELSKKVEAIALQRKITMQIVGGAAAAKDDEKNSKNINVNALKDLFKQLQMCRV